MMTVWIGILVTTATALELSIGIFIPVSAASFQSPLDRNFHPQSFRPDHGEQGQDHGSNHILSSLHWNPMGMSTRKNLSPLILVPTPIENKSKPRDNLGTKRTNYDQDGKLVLTRNTKLPTFTFPPGRKPHATGGPDPKLNRLVPDIIADAGFPVKQHQVTTDDGYVLTLFRIRKRNCSRPGQLPVLLHHGFLGSSADWFMIDENRALPFQLADEGLDVWLANARGTRYSNRHVNMTTKDPAYWNFSFHEIGYYDLPAYFEFMLDHTNLNLPRGERQINYIGHSMGTTVFYICLSEKTQYNNIIHHYIALAPATNLYHMTSPARFLLPLIRNYKLLGRPNGPLIPSTISLFLHSNLPELCTFSIKFLNNQSICENLVFFLAGVSQYDTNNTVLKTYLTHFPEATSYKLLIHFLQLVEYDGFRQFDYGIAHNFKTYGQPVPPNYNLFLVSVDSFNYYGQPDQIIDRRDAESTIQQTGAGKTKTNFLVYDYNHIDFIFGDSAAFAINQDIIGYVNQ